LLETCSLMTVPRGGNLVIRQNRKRRMHYVMEIRFKRRPSLASGKPSAAIHQFVPDWRCNCTFVTPLLKPLDDIRIRNLGDRGRHNAGIKQISKRHRLTLRPMSLTRVDVRKSSSSVPICSNEYFLMKALYTSLNLARSPRNRSNWRGETITATGLPRRVNSISAPASAWSTMVGRFERAQRQGHRVVRGAPLRLHRVDRS